MLTLKKDKNSHGFRHAKCLARGYFMNEIIGFLRLKVKYYRTNLAAFKYYRAMFGIVISNGRRAALSESKMFPPGIYGLCIIDAGKGL